MSRKRSRSASPLPCSSSSFSSSSSSSSFGHLKKTKTEIINVEWKAMLDNQIQEFDTHTIPDTFSNRERPPDETREGKYQKLSDEYAGYCANLYWRSRHRSDRQLKHHAWHEQLMFLLPIREIRNMIIQYGFGYQYILLPIDQPNDIWIDMNKGTFDTRINDGIKEENQYLLSGLVDELPKDDGRQLVTDFIYETETENTQGELCPVCIETCNPMIETHDSRICYRYKPDLYAQSGYPLCSIILTQHPLIQPLLWCGVLFVAEENSATRDYLLLWLDWSNQS